MARDSRDALVSAYFHNKVRNSAVRDDLSITDWAAKTDYFERLMRFYSIWADNRDVPTRFMLVRYEDLHEDPLHELRRVLTFLGVADATDEGVEAAVAYASFDKMRRMEENDRFNSFRLCPVRKGDEDSYKTRTELSDSATTTRSRAATAMRTSCSR